MLLEQEANFADPRALLADLLDGLLPSPDISVAEWAEKNRWLTNAGGGSTGRFSFDMVPYLREPSEKLTDPLHNAVCIAACAQSAKTTVAENWILRCAALDPARFMFFLHTDSALSAYVKTEIEPILERHADVVPRRGMMPKDDSIHFKRMGRGLAQAVEFLTATPSNFINKKAPRIICDEVDNYTESLGDIRELVDQRRQTFVYGSMALFISHPDRAGGVREADWNRGIMSIYRDSTRCLWWWPCMRCGGYSSVLPTASRVMTLHYDDQAPLEEIEATAVLRCPICGGDNHDQERAEMNRYGFWSGRGEEVREDGRMVGRRMQHGTAGYWVHGAMSLLRRGGIGAMARSLEKARRTFNATGEDEDLRAVTVKTFGVPYVRPSGEGSVDAAALVQRCEPLPLGMVPPEVRFLTAFVDANSTWFEYLVRGFGADGESWIIDHGKIAAAPDGRGGERPISPATRPEDWDLLRDRLLSRSWPIAGTDLAMRLRCTLFDIGGKDGTTRQAYDFWRRLRRDRLPALAGRTLGREVWTICPSKGAPSGAAITISHPDSQGRSDRNAGSAGDVPVCLFMADVWKDAVAAQLRRADRGPGYIHFPDALLTRGPDGRPEEVQEFFEQLTAETRDKTGHWSPPPRGRRNEVWDCLVGTEVAAQLWGLGVIDWAAPPPWCANHDRNPLVGPGQRRPDDGGASLPVIRVQPAAAPTSGTSPSAAPNQPAAPRPRRPREMPAQFGGYR